MKKFAFPFTGLAFRTGCSESRIPTGSGRVKAFRIGTQNKIKMQRDV